MSSNSVNLLRMLEPAVRPVQGGAASPARSPVEDQSFEALLAEARGGAGEAGIDAAEKPRGGDVLTPLAGISNIENASLRAMVGLASSMRTAGGLGGGSND